MLGGFSVHLVVDLEVNTGSGHSCNLTIYTYHRTSDNKSFCNGMIDAKTLTIEYVVTAATYRLYYNI